MTARISVIIPVFRSADIVGDAIKSALDQTVPCDVIVVDDASQDGTVEAVRAAAIGHSNVTLLEQSVNQGPAAARNRAISEAKTEFVALLDADDRMAPKRLELLLGQADANDWDFVADDLIRVSDWSKIEHGKRHWSNKAFGQITLSLERFVRQNLPAYSGHGRELGYVKPIMRRSVLIEHDLRYNELMRLGEDFDLYARALAAGVNFGLVDPAGYYAFNSPGSLSKRHCSDDLKALWQASRELLKRKDISVAAHEALKEHVLLTHKRWAWVRLIEAKKNLNPVDAVGAFLAPPPVIGDLITRVGDHFRKSDSHTGSSHQGLA